MDEEMREAHEALEKAINNYLYAGSGEAVFSTGWALITAVSTVSDDSRYVTITSEALPYHSMIGLLTLAKRDAETFSDAQTIQQLLGGIDEDED